MNWCIRCDSKGECLPCDRQLHGRCGAVQITNGTPLTCMTFDYYLGSGSQHPTFTNDRRHDLSLQVRLSSHVCRQPRQPSQPNCPRPCPSRPNACRPSLNDEAPREPISTQPDPCRVLPIFLHDLSPKVLPCSLGAVLPSHTSNVWQWKRSSNDLK